MKINKTKTLSIVFLIVATLCVSTIDTRAQNTGSGSGTTTVDSKSGSSGSSESASSGGTAERNNRRYRNRRSYNNRVSFWSLLFRALLGLGHSRHHRRRY